jgi:hypothetical protein
LQTTALLALAKSFTIFAVSAKILFLLWLFFQPILKPIQNCWQPHMGHSFLASILGTIQCKHNRQLVDLKYGQDSRDEGEEYECHRSKHQSLSVQKEGEYVKQ